MSVYVSAPERKYSVADEGLHEAVCIDVIDLGIVESAFGPAHKVELRFAVDQADEDGRAVIVTARYRASLHEKAKLRQHLELWRGRKFTADELKRFDLEAVLHTPCQLQIVHNMTDDGNVWANVAAIITANKKSAGVPVPKEYTRMKDRPAARGLGNGTSASAQKEEDDDPIPF